MKTYVFVPKMGRQLPYQYNETILKLCIVFSNTIYKNYFQLNIQETFYSVLIELIKTESTAFVW